LAAERAKHGHYEPVRAQKYCDGKLHSYLSTEDFTEFQTKGKEAQKLEFRTVTSPSKKETKYGLDSATGSEEEMYKIFSGISLSDKKEEPDRKPQGRRFSTPGRPIQKTEHTPEPKKGVAWKIKLEKAGLAGSPSAKVLEDAGVLEEEIPQSTLALMGMMDKTSEGAFLWVME
jgi:hypothetical protein